MLFAWNIVRVLSDEIQYVKHRSFGEAPHYTVDLVAGSGWQFAILTLAKQIKMAVGQGKRSKTLGETGSILKRVGVDGESSLIYHEAEMRGLSAFHCDWFIDAQIEITYHTDARTPAP